jgi:hypothetical protein
MSPKLLHGQTTSPPQHPPTKHKRIILPGLIEKLRLELLHLSIQLTNRRFPPVHERVT